ncbi:MAG TPA: rhamnulokinase family protein [Vicinamibacterales bacterium]|nr:rhamnulokinase family protein [Vicinamibacterales bacterium]
MSAHFLAFDLGAESGRAMVGRLRAGALEVNEIHRFSNEPLRQNGTLRWDILRLWSEMRHGLDRLSGIRLDSIGVDAWGCDYALLGDRNDLLENPYHYRDRRTDGIMNLVLERVSRDEIYATTGVQFLTINTLYQLVAATRNTPRLIDAARTLVTIPDLFNFWLTGRLASEFTIATTTQFVDARSRTWATELLARLEVPARLLPPLVEPGEVLGTVQAGVTTAVEGTPVVVPACHDTGSAVASVNAGGQSAFISSGTWSLLGTELPAPVITPRSRELNFTNEGGVCGTTRFLKNIGGMWLLQACRRSWADGGRSFSYEELLSTAEDDRYAFRSLFDPDHQAFLHPASMLTAISEYCRETGQCVPDSPGAFTRAILESLAFKYRAVLESLVQLTGHRIAEIRIVGGGSRNRLLNQFTADATGRTVVAGPAEATALGNLAMQMVATGAVGSLSEARAVIERSFPVERFEPAATDRWDSHYRRFQDYLELTCV